MHKTTWLACIFVLVAGIPRAEAQLNLSDAYAEFSLGFQPSRDYTLVSRPLIYEESALIETPIEVGGAPLIDFGGGIKITPRIAIGLGFSYVSSSDTPSMTAQVPNPLGTDSLRTVTGEAGELSHRETAIHVQVRYIFPVNEKFEVAGFIGPSFYNVGQDIVSGVELTETGEPPDYPNPILTSVTTSRESAWGTAIGIGVDGTYLWTPRFGVGLFLRYAGVSVDLPDGGGGTTEVDAGGFQLGLGVRLRF